jgi:ADP-L-glycero-D-manno-heptose 6-epimerase
MIVVTGGAGFIGSNIVKGLNNINISDILVVDDLTDGKKVRNLSGLNISDYIDYQDFLNHVSASSNPFPRVTAIFHQGACSSTNEWDGRYLMKNNYEYSKKLLEYSTVHSIQFIYASSASVYGLGNKGFKEGVGSEKPINMYAYSKFLFDEYITKQSFDFKTQIVGLRYFNVYGLNEQHKIGMTSPVYNFAKQVNDSGVIKVFGGTGEIGDGEHLRDFVSVEDVVNLNLWLLNNPRVSGIFNCGSGFAESFNSVAQQVIDYYGSGVIEYIDFPSSLLGSYQDYTKADLNNLRSAGYKKDFMKIKEGIHSYLSKLEL